MSINLPIPWRDVETRMFALNVVSTFYLFFFLLYRQMPKFSSRERWCDYSFYFILVLFVYLLYIIVFFIKH